MLHLALGLVRGDDLSLDLVHGPTEDRAAQTAHGEVDHLPARAANAKDDHPKRVTTAHSAR